MANDSSINGSNGAYIPILQVGDVLISSDIITERFCCDLDACHGICCVEGDAGAPVTIDEISKIEDSLDTVWNTGCNRQTGSGVCRPRRRPRDEHRGGKGLCLYVLRQRMLPVCAGEGVAGRQAEGFLQAYQLCPVSYQGEDVRQWSRRTELQPMGGVPRCREEGQGD